MFNNAVVSIHLVLRAGQPVATIREARAVAGQGLEGDRPREPTPDRQVTLIELEAIQAVERDYGVAIAPGQARRNIVTRGVPLNHLVGRQFRVGQALLRGIRLCEPCAHLASLTHEKVLPGLIHRGGLRAQILEGGLIRVGDAIEELTSI